VSRLSLSLPLDKRLGEDIACTADPNWPKVYYIPYDVTVTNISGKEERKRDVRSYGICLPKQPLHLLKPCFPGSTLTFACRWEALNEVLFFLCMHMQLLLFLLNCL